MVKKLQEGDSLRRIIWSDNENVSICEHGCISIDVVYENGQMSGVPWALVKYTNGQRFKYNLALAEGVELV